MNGHEGSHPVRKRLDEAERARRIAALRSLMEPCRLCPRECGALRLSGEQGTCGGRSKASVAHYGAHLGEEPPLSGTRGAGNVFFAGCSLGCSFCQNHQISRPSAVTERNEKGIRELAAVFCELQDLGCHNLGWVTPTHMLPMAVEALFEADGGGLDLPLLYNTSGFERIEVLRLMDGVVDIYLPDLKTGPGGRISIKDMSPRTYFEHALSAIQEMVRQVGPLQVDREGIAVRGVVVRHLVLPADLSDTRAALSSLVERVEGVPLSLMAQYVPPFPGLEPPLDRSITSEEYERACEIMEDLGIEEGWIQELGSSLVLTPDFDIPEPFSRY